MFENVSALSPSLPEDSILLTLPFGGAVLQKVGVSKPEIDALLEDMKSEYMMEYSLDENTDFLEQLYLRLPANDGEDGIDEDEDGAEEYDDAQDAEGGPEYEQLPSNEDSMDVGAMKQGADANVIYSTFSNQGIY